MRDDGVSHRSDGRPYRFSWGQDQRGGSWSDNAKPLPSPGSLPHSSSLPFPPHTISVFVLCLSLSLCLAVSPSLRPSVRPSIRLSVSLSLCLSASVCLSACLPVCLSVSVSVSLSLSLSLSCLWCRFGRQAAPRFRWTSLTCLAWNIDKGFRIFFSKGCRMI